MKVELERVKAESVQAQEERDIAQRKLKMKKRAPGFVSETFRTLEQGFGSMVRGALILPTSTQRTQDTSPLRTA